MAHSSKLLILLLFLLSSVNTVQAQNTFKEEDLYEAINTMYARVIEINKQLPIRLDEITVLTKAVYQHPSIHYFYTIELHKSDFTDEDILDLKTELEHRERENFNYLLQYYSEKGNCDPQKIKEVYQKTGLNIVYNYVDIDNLILFRFTIDYTCFK